VVTGVRRSAAVAVDHAGRQSARDVPRAQQAGGAERRRRATGARSGSAGGHRVRLVVSQREVGQRRRRRLPRRLRDAPSSHLPDGARRQRNGDLRRSARLWRRTSGPPAPPRRGQRLPARVRRRRSQPQSRAAQSSARVYPLRRRGFCRGSGKSNSTAFRLRVAPSVHSSGSDVRLRCHSYSVIDATGRFYVP